MAPEKRFAERAAACISATLLALALATFATALHWWGHLVTSTVALWVTALVLLGSALYARSAISDARRTRHGAIGLEISKRWESRELIESGHLFAQYEPHGVIALLDVVYETPRSGGRRARTKREARRYLRHLDDYNVLIRWPNLMDLIGALWKQECLTDQFIYDTWGPPIIAVWSIWRVPTHYLRMLEGQNHQTDGRHPKNETFRDFQELAERMRELTGLPPLAPVSDEELVALTERAALDLNRQRRWGLRKPNFSVH